MTIKELRTECGITQKHIINEMRQDGFRITRSVYSEKERGIRHFTAKEIQWLCVRFNADIKSITLV